METLGVALVYAGGATCAAGLVSELWRSFRNRPFRWRRVLRWMGTGTLLVIAGVAVPVQEMGAGLPVTSLDRYAPVYQFNEVHEIEIAATRARVYEAIKSTTASEIALFRTLTWLRRLGRPGPESIINAPERRPLLEVATRTSFLLLAEDVGREIVIGTVVLAPHSRQGSRKLTAGNYASPQQAGYAMATMNFEVDELGPRLCRVRTETRVFATDATACRRFSAYWRVIYPGSALIRRMWLRAIRNRALAEGGSAATVE